MTSLIEIQRAFSRICLDETPKKEDLALLHDDDERWLLYRRMVRSRLFGMVRSGLPRSAEVLGKKRLDASMSRYLAEGGVRSRYIRDVVHELALHALPSWEADEELPPYLPDLVRYEAAMWRVSSVGWEATEETSEELDFAGIPVWNPTIHTTRVRYRVDKENEALDEEHLVVIYRKPEGSKIFRYVMNPMATGLYEAWRVPERSFADGVRAVLAADERDPDRDFVDRMAGVLAGLSEHAIILGSRR